MRYVVLDFETRSRADLRKVGAVKYAQDPSTEVLCLGYSIDGGEPCIWTPGLPMPLDLVHAFAGDVIFWAHNVLFERSIWQHIMVARYDWPRVHDDQWADTMASCAYRALPLKLEKVGAVVGLEELKDTAGNRLLGQITKPKRNGEFDDDVEKHERIYDYCLQDVRTELGLLRRVGPLPKEERRLWLLDQTINLRGVRVDLDAVDAALAIVAQVEKKLTAELRDITGGAVETVGQRDKLIAWLWDAHGWPMKDLTSESVGEALQKMGDVVDCFDPAVRRALEIRQTLAKTSTKKLAAMKHCACDDGRMRGLLQYHGAGTGRWAGRLVQPQNFTRPALNAGKGVDGEQLIADILMRDADYLEMVYGNPMFAIADAMRPMLIAGEGMEFAAADLGQIEARVAAWFGREQWKLDAFRAIDAGEGEDIYCLTASQVFGRRITKAENPKERQVGKVCELAFGYQGGLGAWRNFDASDDHTDEQVDGYKNAWREKHPGIVDCWYGLERAAVSAVSTGQEYSHAGVTYGMEGPYLWCRVPSGGRIWYRDAALEETVTPWGETKPQVVYWAWKYGQWRKVHAYGGHDFENVVQKVSRDIMAEGMWRCEAAEYPVVLTVHDEVLTEPRAGRADEDTIALLLAQAPAWAPDLPVAAEGWIGRRYRK